MLSIVYIGNNSASEVTRKQALTMKVPVQGLGSYFNKASNNTLDLSKKNLHCLAEDLYKSNRYLQNLHLEGNSLISIPEKLFLQLQHLVWLDLRYNKITSLPQTIGELRYLKYLLLEGNPIKALPVELGDISTLKALNLRHCPLDFPPQDIVQKGIESILLFLQNAKTAVHRPSEVEESTEMEFVEKLKLSELKNSVDMSDECESDEERIRFEMLKNRLKQQEMEEIVENLTLGLQAVPHVTREQIRKEKGGFLTKLRYGVPTEGSKALRHAEEKERLAVINQRQKDRETLEEWQKQTKLMKDNVKKKKKKANHKEVPAAIPPYATDLDQNGDNCNMQKTLVSEKQEMNPGVVSAKSLRQLENERASRDHRLEQRIREHIQAMRERRKNPRGTAQEEMEAARKELEMATLLQDEIFQRKHEQETPLEYRFTAFTGDVLPSL
ncbi:leucine-rich repeat-containing 27 [Pelobates cultripes]|uniref:Leucine-rich repeat-containing 27 n=1 Tax=Pelobates cultripes TaxID=61616 RepID=A0AAD1TB66_PELCU|nr:leucine-rich repeat-containing 27 [Pelobates cultripes]